MVSVEIKMKDVMKKLSKLPEKVQKRVVTGAVRASAKPIVQEAKRLVPVKTGNLKKSIGITKIRSKSKTEVVFAVSPRKTAKYDGFYGRFVEFGHVLKEKGKGKKGKVIGHAPPKPFLRPAYEKMSDECLRAFKEYMIKRIDKELAKL